MITGVEWPSSAEMPEMIAMLLFGRKVWPLLDPGAAPQPPIDETLTNPSTNEIVQELMSV